jgi:hypothetical protein
MVNGYCLVRRLVMCVRRVLLYFSSANFDHLFFISFFLIISLLFPELGINSEWLKRYLVHLRLTKKHDRRILGQSGDF